MNTAATTMNLPASNASFSPQEQRALELLGIDTPAVAVAAALGVSESRISQMLSSDVFSAEVARLRYERLKRHSVTDDAYDKIENKLLQKLEADLCLIMQPMQVLKALQIINAAKRRGASSSPAVLQSQNIVNITLPSTLAKQYIQVNINNQVVKAGEQSLVTIGSQNLLKQLEGSKSNEHAIERGN